jgi:hypothetical protein
MKRAAINFRRWGEYARSNRRSTAIMNIFMSAANGFFHFPTLFALQLDSAGTRRACMAGAQVED